MSVANLTHMTMVNLNNKVGSRIMENPLELEEESLLTLVLLVLLTVEGGASPLVAPLVAPLMAVAPAATSLVSSDVLSFASIASSGSLVIRFTVVGHVLLTVVVVDDDDDDDDECLMGNNVDRGNCCRCRDLVVVVENCGAPNPEAVVASKPRSAVVDSMRRMINYLMCYFYLLQIYIYRFFSSRCASFRSPLVLVLPL